MLLDKRFRRFGWFDDAGPLWFLRDRWTATCFGRTVWIRFFAGPTGVTMQAHRKESCHAQGGVFVDGDLWKDLSYGQKEDLVMSWLKRLKRPEENPGGGSAALDPDWVSELPALHDYLTLLSDPDGSPRRTATIALFAEHGSWKVYLNDRDSGASLCASGGTVAGALSALEVMLEGDNAPWRFSDRPKPASAGKGKRSS
jgi:hypothetical protein